jgi:serine/threonine protein kinase
MIQNQQGASPDSLVREVIARWREGERPDAQEFLRQHPQIRERKSLAIDLIYEEYCLRREHGETLVASTFMSRFPAYKQSLVRMLDVHEVLAGAAPAAAPVWPGPGEEFLGFEIVEQIGAGAVAKVFLARELEVGGRLVVIKVSQFGRGEARLMGKVSHPGVVPIHSVRADPLTGMTCICMPFLGTATLVDLLDEAFVLGSAPASAAIVGTVAPGYLPADIDSSAWGPVDPFFRRATYEEGIVYLGRQIAAALAKAHQAGITHRDIKPSNVLLSRDARPMLLDFNLSTDERLPAERIGGTLAYMAPERIEFLVSSRAETETTSDPRSDLYSVGAMLYELLTGRLPSHPASSDGAGQASLDQWRECRRTPPGAARLHNPRVEPCMDAVLTRLLAPDPDDRFESAAELTLALAALLAPQARAVRYVRRRRRAFLAAGCGLTAAAAAAGLYWATHPPLPTRLLEAGLAAYDRGQYAQAKDLFTRSIEAGNDSIEVYFARGQTHRQLKDAAGQEKDFAEVNRRDTAQVGIGWIYAAEAAREAGYPAATVAHLFRARDSGWDTVGVANSLAIALARDRRFEMGIGEFDRILRNDSTNDDVRYNRTLCWFHYSFSNSQPPIAPDKQSLADAELLANKYPDNVQVRNVTAFLLCNAANLDRDKYVERARDHLEKAEALGTHRIHTHPFRTKIFGDSSPRPKILPGAPRPPLQLGWREMPPPTSPRMLDCVELLNQDHRLR